MKIIQAIAFLIGCSLFFSFCSLQDQPKKYVIGFSQCCADSWRDLMLKEMRRELAFHPEIELKVLVANNNSGTQSEQIKTLLAEHVDLMIVSPNESEPLTAAVEAVFHAGIPVILIDRKIESNNYTAYIGADNREIGKTAAKYIVNAFNGRGRIVELQLGLSMTPAQDRTRGFNEELVHYPGMTMVSQLEMTEGFAGLRDTFLRTMKAHPEVNIVFAHNDELAKYASKWLEEVNDLRDVFLVGIDGIAGNGQGIQAVEDGSLDASLLYPTGGAEAIRLGISILNNLHFEKNNLLQTIVIEKENARILHLQMKKVESQQATIDNQLKHVENLSVVQRNQRIFIFVLVGSLLLVLVLAFFLYRLLKKTELINDTLALKNAEVMSQKSQIEDISAKLQTALQAKLAFFTNISHEFRSPLTLILGHLEGLIATSNVSSKTAQGELVQVRKNALRLLHLINQLMDFRKIESDKMLVRASENDLVAFVADIVSSYRKMADKRNIDLKLLAHEQSILVWFDVNMVDKVLFNLLSNAFNHTKDGGTIKATVALDLLNNRVAIKVEDNGTGMTREAMQHVFEPFYQSANRTNKGTGLGLSLSHELVSLHQGKIEVFSELDRGTLFEVFLPLGFEHFSESQRSSSNNTLADRKTESQNMDLNLLETPIPLLLVPEVKPDLKDKTMLVIEDNSELRDFLTKHFKKHYNIIEAENGQSGFDLAVAQAPDIILTDIVMPAKNGLELTKMLKSDLRTSHIPVVLITAQNSIDQKTDGIKAGADAYVTKPFNLVFLTNVVENLLNSRAAMRKHFDLSYDPSKLKTNMSQLDQEFITNFTKYIDEHYTDANLSVEQISETFGLSRVQIYRKLKDVMGESVSDYLQHVRLKKASQLLLDSDLNIAEVAYKVGYSSPAYFATAFKNKYACSPSAYRVQKGK
jgi:signal transduction histidine kinase/AraC-like DNA-binding protein/CheY-like chemotaxis protein